MASVFVHAYTYACDSVRTCLSVRVCVSVWSGIRRGSWSIVLFRVSAIPRQSIYPPCLFSRQTDRYEMGVRVRRSFYPSRRLTSLHPYLPLPCRVVIMLVHIHTYTYTCISLRPMYVYIYIYSYVYNIQTYIPIPCLSFPSAIYRPKLGVLQCVCSVMCTLRPFSKHIGIVSDTRRMPSKVYHRLTNPQDSPTLLPLSSLNHAL